MKVTEPRQGQCLCGNVHYRLEPPAELKDGLICTDHFTWTEGSEWVLKTGRWNLCRRCGTTICSETAGRKGLLAQLGVPLDALHVAARKGNVAKVRELLASGLPVDAEIDDYTPLMLAARKPYLEVCGILLEHGANPKWVRDFHLGRRKRDIAALVKLLVLQGSSPQAMVSRAIRAGLVDAVKVLMEAGADTNLPDERGLRPLHAAADSSWQMLQLLLDCGAKLEGLSAGGGHALGFCALWGHAGKVQRLLQAGFPVDLPQEQPADTALFAACREGRFQCAHLLLEYGANPNLPCEGVTPLMAAARHGSLALVELLLERGANPALLDHGGRAAGDYVQDPSVLGKTRRSTNSAGEPTLSMPFGRGRWTLCQPALRERLMATGSLGAHVPQGLHSIDFSALREVILELDPQTWKAARRAGHAGDREAQYLLGSRNLHGNWRQHASYNRWLQLAAQAGHPEATRDADLVGDTSESAYNQKMFRAAQLGSLEAMRDYAACSVDLDLPDNGYSTARPWYLKAALGGHCEAQLAVGSMLLDGDGGPADPAKGLEFIELATRNDDRYWAAIAAGALAEIYSLGRKVPPDPEKAEYWKARAAALTLEKEVWWDQRRGFISKRKTP